MLLQALHPLLFSLPFLEERGKPAFAPALPEGPVAVTLATPFGTWAASDWHCNTDGLGL